MVILGGRIAFGLTMNGKLGEVKEVDVEGVEVRLASALSSIPSERKRFLCLPPSSASLSSSRVRSIGFAWVKDMGE